jgi:hypothetical protein
VERHGVRRARMRMRWRGRMRAGVPPGMHVQRAHERCRRVHRRRTSVWAHMQCRVLRRHLRLSGATRRGGARMRWRTGVVWRERCTVCMPAAPDTVTATWQIATGNPASMHMHACSIAHSWRRPHAHKRCRGAGEWLRAYWARAGGRWKPACVSGAGGASTLLPGRAPRAASALSLASAAVWPLAAGSRPFEGTCRERAGL